MRAHTRLVSGTDFSPCAEHALEVAIALAAGGPLHVALVHVCDPGPDDLADPRWSACEQALAALVAKHRRGGVEITGVLRTGRPWDKLDNVAAEVGARAIVVGRHGAGRGLALAIGSVAERLVRSASRPVLTVGRAS